MNTAFIRRTLVLATAFVAFAAPSGHASEIVIGPWAANHLLCSASRCASPVSSTGEAIVNQGDVVGFWQNILSADGYASICTSNGIDGRFGSRTESNTRAWQAAFDLPGTLVADGIVGPNTWTAAQRFVVVDGFDGLNNYQHYSGASRSIGIVYELGIMSWQKAPGLSGPFYIRSGHPSIGFGTC